MTYKVVESSTVTDEELERIVNEQTTLGWHFDGFHFVTRENSRRPGMVFVLFRREPQPTTADQPQRTPRKKGDPRC